MGLFSSKKQKLYEKGRDAMRRGEDSAAVQYLSQAAELGHPGAGMILGDWSRRGEYGLAKDYAKALRYYELNPEPWGRASMAMLYFYGGNGLEQDWERALALFRESLEAKKYRFDQAEGFLGAMHFWGRGLEQSYEKAARYLEKYQKSYYGEYPDIDYCYAYLRIYGLGGVAKSPKEGLEKMEEICRRAETREIRLSAARELRKGILEMDGDELQEYHLTDLETAARAGDIQAACKAAVYYMTHVRIHTRKYWDEEEGEWVEALREETDLWPKAEAMLKAALRCPKPEALEDQSALSLLLLWHGQDIKEREPALHAKLLALSRDLR